MSVKAFKRTWVCPLVEHGMGDTSGAGSGSASRTRLKKKAYEVHSLSRDRSLDVSDGSEYVAMLRPGVRARLEAREGE